MSQGIKTHEWNGQKISQVIASRGISKSDLIEEILEKTPGPNSFEIAVSYAECFGGCYWRGRDYLEIIV